MDAWHGCSTKGSTALVLAAEAAAALIADDVDGGNSGVAIDKARKIRHAER